MTSALMLFHDAAQLQPLQLRRSFAFTGRLGRSHGYSLCCGRLRAPNGQNGASGVVALFDTALVPHSWVTVGMRSLLVFGAAAVRVEAQRRTIRV
jgi:hypothetical protein